MRGRARGNPRANWDCERDAADLLEDMNFGRPSEFTEEERLGHCAYYVGAYGARVRAPTLFAASAGSTVYLSRKERNRMQHALVGNTGASDVVRGVDGGVAADERRVLDCGDRLGRWRNKCLQVSVLSMCPRSMKGLPQ